MCCVSYHSTHCIPLPQLDALKERLHELLTELEGTAACDGSSDVAQRQPTIPLPSTVKEGVTVNSLVSPPACDQLW